MMMFQKPVISTTNTILLSAEFCRTKSVKKFWNSSIQNMRFSQLQSRCEGSHIQVDQTQFFLCSNIMSEEEEEEDEGFRF